MKIFETHAHLDFEQYEYDRSKVILEAMNKGVKYFINIGVDEETSKNSIKLAEKYKNFYATVGYHPHDAKKFDESVVRELAIHSKVVAIGEIGLDYYRNRSPKKIQQKVFEKQIEIAMDLNKPIVVHDRDAHDDTMNILEKYNPKDVVFHCFAGNLYLAEKIIEKGWKLSITGVVTFKNSDIQNVVKNIPLEHIFVETDSPYLTPCPNRGKRNQPSYLRYIISKIADIKSISPNKVADITYENAKRFFLKNT